MRRLIWAVGLVALFGFAGCGTEAESEPGHAPASQREAVTSNGWAWAWANQPTAASYTPATAYQYNYGPSGAALTITRSGTGIYQVFVPHLGISDGTVHVSPMGPWGTTCKVAGWSGVSNLTINVRCFDVNSNPVDSQFTVAFTDVWVTPAPGVSFAYAWNNQASAPQDTWYSLPSAYQRNNNVNNNNAPITIERIYTGLYVVKIPGMGSPAAAIATAYGSTPGYCSVSSVGADSAGNGTLVVRCYKQANELTRALVDSMFTLSAVAGIDLLGRPPAPGYAEWGYNSFLSADSAGTTPVASVSGTPGTTPGSYLDLFPGLSYGNRGTVLFNQRDHSPCELAGWDNESGGVGVHLSCSTWVFQWDRPATTDFDVFYMSTQY